MTRIWHDSAMKWMLLWLCITMMNTSVALGVIFWRQASRTQDLQPSTLQFLVVLWLAIAFYFVFGSVRTRCQQIELTLPIPTRTLWRRHFVAVFLAGSLVLAGSLAVLTLHASMIARVGRSQSLEIPYLTLIGPLLGGLLLATALVSSIDPGQWKLAGRSGYWALVVASLVGIPSLLAGLIGFPLVSTGICVILAAAISWRTEQRLPGAFRLAPAAAAARTDRDSAAASSDRSVGTVQIYRTLFNLLHTSPPWKQFTPWMVYTFVALMGFVVGGGIERWMAAEDARILYLPFGSYMLFAGIGVLSYNLFRLDSIPVSRRTILAVLVLPGLFFYCAGYATGWWARTSSAYPSQLVNFNIQRSRVEVDLDDGEGKKPTEIRRMVWVEVDSRFMGMSLFGDVPMLTSPWGESHEAWHEELLRGAVPVLYNPYNTSEETSPEFEALMLSRAIEDVYGRKIPPEELQDRYFVVEDGDLVTLRAFREAGNIYTPGYREKWPIQGFPLLDDYPDLVAPPKGPETSVFLALALVPSLLLTAMFLGSFKATHSSKYIRGIYWAGLAIPMLGMLSQVLLGAFGIFSPEAGRSFLAIVIRSLGTSPVLWAFTWLVCLASVTASYWLALRRFEGAEIPSSPINCSLVDWGTDD